MSNKLTAYMSNPNASDEVDISLWLQSLQGLEDLVDIIGEGHTHLSATEGRST